MEKKTLAEKISGDPVKVTVKNTNPNYSKIEDTTLTH